MPRRRLLLLLPCVLLTGCCAALARSPHWKRPAPIFPGTVFWASGLAQGVSDLGRSIAAPIAGPTKSSDSASAKAGHGKDADPESAKTEPAKDTAAENGKADSPRQIRWDLWAFSVLFVPLYVLDLPLTFAVDVALLPWNIRDLR